jgi:methylglutaconyl-CoA hydratase
MTYSTIALDHHGAVATLWLNRPEIRNAFSDVMIAELDSALAALAAEPTVRVIVLAGRGPVFSAGADLNWMRRMAGYSKEENQVDAEKLALMLHRLYTVPKPTIARVHGDCFAGGLGLVAACDIAVAVESVTFCLTEVRIGLIPATIGPYVVRAMGERQASRYALTAERFTAAAAHTAGLIHEVSSAETLDATIDSLTAQLLLASPVALAESKRLIRDVGASQISPELASETAERIAVLRASDEGREGIAAFLERRKPSWLPPSS